MKPSELVYTLPDAELVAAVIGLPDGTDVNGLPFVNQLKLGQDGADRCPSRVNGIFNEVAHHSGASSWMRLAATNARIDAMRRTQASEPALLMKEADEVLAAVLARSTSLAAAEFLLCGDIHYNRGLLFRMMGDYAAATAAQLCAAEWYRAAGRMDKARVSGFVAKVEHATWALTTRVPAVFKDPILTLHADYVSLPSSIDPVPAWFVKAGGGNGILHVRFARLIAKLMGATLDSDSSYERDMATIADLATPPGKPNHWTKMFVVAQLLDQSQNDAVVTQAGVMLEDVEKVDSSSIANVLLTLRLLRAAAYIAMGRNGDAMPDLTSVIAWAGHDGGAPKAAAMTMLGTLDGSSGI